MDERLLVVISYGVSWFVLGWGTYAFVRVLRWRRRRATRDRGEVGSGDDVRAGD